MSLLRDAHSRFLNYVLASAGIISVYFLAGKFGLTLAFVNESVTPVWPPTGIAIATLLVFGRSFWPSIFIGAFLVNVITTHAIIHSLVVAVGNTMEGLLGAYLANRFARGARAFDNPWDIVKFTALAGFLATMASATVGVTSLAWHGLIDWANYFPTWLTWWLGDASGAVIVAPLLILWHERRWLRRTYQETFEFGLVLFSSITVGIILFGGVFHEQIKDYPLGYLCFPFLVWAAYRLGAFETAVCVLVVSLIATKGTVQGFGSFVRESPNESLLLLQTFMDFVSVMALSFAAIVTRNKKIEQELLAKERRFRRLIENSTDMITLIDAQGTIVFTSPSTTQILGYSLKEYIGRNIFEMVHPEDSPRIKKRLEEVLKKPGNFVQDECRYLHKDGTWRWLERSGKNLLYDATIRAIVTNCRDITQRRKAEEKAQEYNEELKESNKELEQFAFVASHDLQEPLRIVASYLQLFLKRYENLVDDKGRKYSRYMSENIQRLQDMIKGLLDYSRVGKEDREKQAVNSSEICDRAIEVLKLPIMNSKARIRREALPVIKANEVELLQLFQNFINNAIKYCDKEIPEVCISAKRSGPKWLFAVSDNGIGIEREYRNQIFDLFKRLHTKQEYPGTGIGLAICKKIVERNGGEIWVESQVGQGSTFYFTFPIESEILYEYQVQ